MTTNSVLNFKNILFGAGIFAVVVAMLGFSGRLPGFGDKAKQSQFSGQVRIWGTLPAENLSKTLDLFNQNVAKTYTVTYKEFTEGQISDQLIRALADGKAPDLILAPYSIALQNENRISPISNRTISEIDYRNTFVDEAQVLISNQGYLGFPISVDPLIMYYNRDLLSSAGLANPPVTWDQFFNYASKITTLNANNTLKVSTIAFGTYNNIPHITDILMAMIMQLGQGQPIVKSFGQDAQGNIISKYKVLMNQDPKNPEAGSGPLNIILAFMKNFSDSQKETYNWNSLMPNALSQFIAGNLAFYIGYSSELGYIKSANQKLYFDYTYFPQVSNTNTSLTYGKMYTLMMLKNSRNPGAAYMTMLNLSTGVFSANLVSATGGVSALKNILATPSGDQASIILGRSGLIAKGFQNLHPKDLEALVKEAIEGVNNGYSGTVEAAKTLVDNLQNIYEN